MFKISSYETFQDGQTIFEEGSHGDWIYVVEEGEVEISKPVVMISPSVRLSKQE